MRRILKVLIVLVVLVLIVVVTVPLWIDGAAKRAVEEGGTYALGVRTTLDRISISLFGGEAEMSGLKIDNPEGFRTPHFMKLGDGQVAVNVKSVMADKVVIPTLFLDNIDVNLDRADKRANYEVIMENLKKFESREPAPEEEGKTFVIEEVVIRNVNVNAKLSIAGVLKPVVPVRIEELRFQNVGEGGIPMARVFDLILKAVLKGIIDSGAGILPKEIMGGLREGLGALGDVGGLAIRVLGEGGKVLEGAGKAVDDVAKGIGGIFEKKKKEEDK